MRLFLATIFMAFCMSIGLGIYAQNAVYADIPEEKAGYKMENVKGGIAMATDASA